jgi:2-dehydropantoate 2-reductase
MPDAFSKTKTPPLIIGCGGIGGVLGAHLHRSKWPLHIATTNAEVRERWARTGPYLDGKLVRPSLPTRYLHASTDESEGPYDLVIVAVQPPQLEQVARSLKSKLTNDGHVVCLSNGMCEPYLAKELGAERVLGAVVAWGARMRSPGHYERTSRGGFVLGALDPSRTDPSALNRAKELLQVMAPVEETQNLKGVRMSKLIINCAISTLGTIGGDTLGALLVQKHVRKLAISIMREAVEVAHAQGIQLESIGPISVERLVGTEDDAWRDSAIRHALLLTVGARYRRLRSSMLASMERGRMPAVDFLNGEIEQRGREKNLATPYNSAARAVIWEIFRGGLSPGPEALAQVDVLAQGKQCLVLREVPL